MKQAQLSGVIAAAATPIDRDGEPDLRRFVRLCHWLLDNGCDGLNICGTTGEATSFSAKQRKTTMSAAAEALPRERLMVGTGAAALADAVALTRHAAELGFAGALLLPPFYYKGVPDDGIVRFFDRIASATAKRPIDLYLYNFPALSGIAYSPALVRRLLDEFGSRIRGLKDSSGDLDYAADIAALSRRLSVFPSNEAVLLEARAGVFAGCISATANVNSRWCARAFHKGETAAQATASLIRAAIARKPLIAGVKAVLAEVMDDSAFEALLPPLTPLSAAEKAELLRDYHAIVDEERPRLKPAAAG
ncbi:MAG TPA: dihydrodipicolinate synthase family protein [Propylenella sp.]|nr:dihydrodipicolinate synthase family protein [Propylenella sp.]